MSKAVELLYHAKGASVVRAKNMISVEVDLSMGVTKNRQSLREVADAIRKAVADYDGEHAV